MGKKLGLYVSSDEHMEKIIKLCQAAKRKDVEVTLFLTHLGTNLTQDPRLEELLDLASVSLCKVGYEDRKLKKPVVDLVWRISNILPFWYEERKIYGKELEQVWD
jgi:uncharacterized tellurite resistance protein B-like protein